MAGAPALSLAMLAAAVAATAPLLDPDMRAATDRLLVEVGALRRLPFRGTLERGVETRAEAQARREAERAAAAADPELGARARLWERLGLLPSATDGARLGGAALDAGPVASYDPLGRRLFVPDWIPLGEQRLALAHALAHALADQRFGIRDLLGIDLEGRHHLDGDAERARAALIEGDASLTALELDDPAGALTSGHALPAFATSIAGAPGASNVPAWLRENASFAHADGMAFVARVRARQTWSAVDALWADPPQSSEQILHPEKYAARERPISLPAQKLRALGGAWREAASDVLGELGARCWLAAAVPSNIAERAAAGWGGDRAVLYVAVAARAPDAGAPPPPFAVWSTAWDDVTDAEDFARAAAAALAALGAAPAPGEDPHRVVVRGAAGVFALVWRGLAVDLLVGAPESALGALDELAARAPPKPPPRRSPAAPPAPRPVRRGKGGVL
ncbi:MAG TPA: hypothetical protein VG319_13050 [Polyangia bacterium]|nr:hypothetical protein [Polyangia bacterium]